MFDLFLMFDLGFHVVINSPKTAFGLIMENQWRPSEWLGVWQFVASSALSNAKHLPIERDPLKTRVPELE